MTDYDVQQALKYLQSDEWLVRQPAARVLGQVGDARAVVPRIDALGDGDSHVRRRAAEALGRLGDARSVSSLIRALGDGNRHVREAAAQALGRLGEQTLAESVLGALRGEPQHLLSLGDARWVAPLLRAWRMTTAVCARQPRTHWSASGSP